MADTNKKQEVLELIEQEMQPLKEKYDALVNEKKELDDEKKKIEERLEEEKLEAEETKTALENENKRLEEQMSTLSEMVEKLTSRNKTLVREARMISDRAKKAIREAKDKAEAAKSQFIEDTTQRLEEHINDITKSAYRSAKVLFEQDFSTIERDLLKDMGKLLAPYISDPSTPAKMRELRKALTESIKERESLDRKAATKLRDLLEENQNLSEKMSLLSKSLRTTKLSVYKEKMLSKLPSSSRDSARDRMAKANTISEIERIYISVLKESTARQKATPNPVVEKRPAKADRSVMKEVNIEQANKDVGDPDDPELLRRAGLLD